MAAALRAKRLRRQMFGSGSRGALGLSARASLAYIGLASHAHGASRPGSMILSCPNCATRFGVPDHALQPAGRTVKCSRCAHLWFVGPDGEPAPAPVPALVGQPAPEPQPQPQPEPPPVATPEPPASETTPPRDFDAAIAPGAPESAALAGARAAARAQLSAASRPKLASWLGWTAFVAVVSLLAIAIYFHEVFAAEYPSTRPFYRITKLMPQMNHDGLKVQKLTVEPDLGQVDARSLPAAVTVRGEVVNESWIPRTIKTLQGSLRDVQRQEIQRWDVATARTWLWPGQAIAFGSDVPLQGVRPFEVVINLGPLE
jgi:predicted Zn finger-like uncharacterized protein